MKIRFYIEYAVLKALLGVCRLLPESWVFALFRMLGILSYYFLFRRRTIALSNVALVFPDKTRKDRIRTVRKSLCHFSESLALNTLIMSGRISNERLLDLVEVDGWERLERTVKDTTRGVVVVSGHIGNWELLPLYTALRLQITCHIVARRTNNPLIEQRIMLPMRERFGIKVIYKKNALMRIIQATRKGKLAGIMIDQKLNLKQGVPIEFFGRTAGTTGTPALLQIRFGATTLPAFMVQTGRLKYKMIVHKPVEWSDNSRPLDEQVAELTARHQGVMEQIIRQYPEQWFWVHDRWGLWKQRKKK